MRIGKQSRAQVNRVREQVFERDGYRCVVADSLTALEYPCAGELTIQHAVSRGMGGSALFDGIDYLRAMCSFHNGLDTSNALFRQTCLRNGWSIQRWMALSEGVKMIPVKYPDGWCLLQDGKRVPISDETAEAIQEDLDI